MFEDSFGVQGIGRGVLYSFPSSFFLFSLVETAMARGLDFLSFGFSELGLTNWAIFLTFYSNWVNYTMSMF